jgi:hypothetical protein
MRWAGWPPPDEEGERTRQHNNQKITEEGGETVVTAVRMTMTMKTTTTTMMKPRIDRGCGGGKWQAVATALAVATRGCFGMIIWHPH